ncbi:hypothetical protein [Streptomyces bluensis]|uniref:Uncharacterized protein n=1 Tax=Streptomyces bluensis TaxID=33897 RepID=A0ABW6UBZ8_9ACTN
MPTHPRDDASQASPTGPISALVRPTGTTRGAAGTAIGTRIWWSTRAR